MQENNLNNGISTDMQKKMLAVMKQQAFFNKVIAVCLIIMLAMFLCVGIVGVSYMGKINKCMNQVDQLMAVMDVDKVNNIMNKADTVLDNVSGILETTNKAVEKVAELLEKVQAVSNTVDEMQEKVSGMIGM